MESGLGGANSMKRERKGKLTPRDGDPRHGQNGYSNYRCRCDICRAANAKTHYEYMQRSPEQQKKNRDRQRQSRGLGDDELVKLEQEYQDGEHRQLVDCATTPSLRPLR